MSIKDWFKKKEEVNRNSKEAITKQNACSQQKYDTADRIIKLMDELRIERRFHDEPVEFDRRRAQA